MKFLLGILFTLAVQGAIVIPLRFPSLATYAFDVAVVIVFSELVLILMAVAFWFSAAPDPSRPK